MMKFQVIVVSFSVKHVADFNSLPAMVEYVKAMRGKVKKVFMWTYDSDIDDYRWYTCKVYSDRIVMGVEGRLYISRFYDHDTSLDSLRCAKSWRRRYERIGNDFMAECWQTSVMMYAKERIKMRK